MRGLPTLDRLARSTWPPSTIPAGVLFWHRNDLAMSAYAPRAALKADIPDRPSFRSSNRAPIQEYIRMMSPPIIELHARELVKEYPVTMSALACSNLRAAGHLLSSRQCCSPLCGNACAAN